MMMVKRKMAIGHWPHWLLMVIVISDQTFTSWKSTWRTCTRLAFASIAWTLKQTKKRHTHQVQLVQDPDYQAEAILVNPPAHRLAVRLYEVNQVLWRRLSWSLWWLFWLFVNMDVKIESDNERQSWSYVIMIGWGWLIIISGTFVTWMILVVVVNMFGLGQSQV